ncbi:MAG: hypothetical protein IJK55_08845 [Bacteroidales bacterium]|nr:hypothetical protein [Bacteroidales bacterium]
MDLDGDGKVTLNEAIQYTKEKAGEIAGKAKVKLDELGEEAKKEFAELKVDAAEVADKVKDKYNELGAEVKDLYADAKEKVKDVVGKKEA